MNTSSNNINNSGTGPHDYHSTNKRGVIIEK